MYIGQNGIEYVFEKYLKGKNGVKQIDMSVDGGIVSEETSKEAISGSNVVLTIDANLQATTEKALKEALTNTKNTLDGAGGADAGAIVTMNVKTGEVLSMASYPDFAPSEWVGGIDPEVYKRYISEGSNFPFVNRAISSTYAPGSTFKMVSAVAALQTGNTTPTEKINDTGVYPHGHNPVCWIYTSRKVGHGYLNITNAIKHSCNYFFYEMGYRMGIDNLDKYAKSFGLGSKTGIELTSEAAGTLASRELTASKGEVWTEGFTLSAVIGQGDNDFTPIQMAKYISILVNGGKQVNPTIIKTIINADGSEVNRKEITENADTRIKRTANSEQDIEISEENLKAILEGMKGVTSESGGTAYGVFRNFNIEVGGKTGTAQKGNSANAWFVGFAPYDNPEIAVVCIIENGGNSSIATLPARDVIAQYFGMNEVEINENIQALPNIEMQN